MDAQFWIDRWKEGRISFHQDTYHDKLTEYFPRLNPQRGQSVLVPLCGKTKDLLWLRSLNLYVHGVELHGEAVEAFFSENGLPSPKISRNRDFTRYTNGNIVISCGDFFKLNEAGAYDYVYDRASLVALPPHMREDYARVIKQSLKPGGKCLLIAYEYDQSKMDGPPFSIPTDEIRGLYEDQFSIERVESRRPATEGSRFDALDTLSENVYILEKKL